MFGSITYRIAAIAAGSVALILGVALLFAWMGESAAKRQVKDLHAALDTTNQALGECKANLTQANGELEAQSAQVRQWRDQAAQVQRDADARVAKAQAEAAQYRKRATQLATRPAPTAGQCEAAAALYVEVISEDAR